MDADPRGAASREIPVANSVPIIVTCFDPFGGTRRGLEGPSQGLRLPSGGGRMTYARWLGFPEDTPAILSALFGRAALPRPRFDFKVMARIALRSPIPLPPADATRGVGRFLYGDARVRHTLAMLSLAPGPGPGGGGGS